jgi:putative Mg2+ transporter-C (MgtC) family protein
MNIQDFLIRFVVALFVGALIGFEREMIGKKAGVRTMMLVCGGSALYAMISIIMPHFAQQMYGEYTVRAVDMSRIISNIAVGIGFLGAGVIIQAKGQVRGLTTAATIWTAAAIGVLVGIGLMWWGVIAGILVSATLFILRSLDVSEKIKNKTQ